MQSRPNDRVLLALATVLLLGVTLCAAPAPDQQESTLRITDHRWTQDSERREWLDVDFVNDGAAPIRVVCVAASGKGPWTAVNRDVAAGDTFTARIRLSRNGTSTIWVATKHERHQIPLPPRKQ